MAQTKQAKSEENGYAEVTQIGATNGLPKELEPDPDYEPTYELRKLNAGDTIRVWRWIRAAQAEDTIRDAAIEGGAGAAQYAVIDVLMGKVEDEFYPWLKDMAGLKDKADEELDADAPIALVSDLANHPDFLGVFKSALRATRAIQRIFSLFATEPESQDEAEDGQTQNS